MYLARRHRLVTRRADEPFGKAFRKGKAQAAAPQGHARDAAALEHGLQAPHHRFDFGKFWHGPA